MKNALLFFVVLFIFFVICSQGNLQVLSLFSVVCGVCLLSPMVYILDQSHTKKKYKPLNSLNLSEEQSVNSISKEQLFNSISKESYDKLKEQTDYKLKEQLDDKLKEQPDDSISEESYDKLKEQSVDSI